MVLFVALAAAVLTAARVLLVAWQYDRVVDAGMLPDVAVQGLRFDLIIAGFAILWPVLLIPFLLTTVRGLAIWRKAAPIYFSAWIGVLAFMELSTPAFVDQFDARPNRIFVEYLVYPKEVASTLLTAYTGQLGAAVLLVAGVVWLSRRFLTSATARSRPLSLPLALVLTAALVPVCALMIRSTLDHRPVNPSTVALSDDPLVNDLALNSAYTTLYALYEMRHEPAGGFRYSDMPEAEVVEVVRREMGVHHKDFTDPAAPTMHLQTATAHPDRPKNIVIILEESLGAEYVGSMGGLPLTPNLDALRQQGLWFENMYATGTRSVRGLEALITGFTPTPARSVVKLSGSQRDFYSIATTLRDRGYDTAFLYGGESQFDNMRRFFMNNGFERALDEDDFPEAEFHGSWGVADEELLRHAHQEFMAPHDRPFFALVFTTSNHSPYDFPEGKIDLYEQPKATVDNAVKYADYALGQFFSLARESPYWDDTIFMVVADHNSRVYGAELVPIEHFHIPALILGGGIAPSAFAPVASQIDLPPTLLSLAGVSAIHPMIGHDLTRPEFAAAEGRAIMQYYGTQAYMRGDEVEILRQDLAPEPFRYDGTRLVRCDEPNPELERIALAHANWSSLAYEKKLYGPYASF